MLSLISVAVTHAADTSSADHQKPLNQKDRLEALGRFESYMEPPMFERAPYYGRVTLSLGLAENIINNQRLRHLSYNGGLVGPTIRVRPGDTIEVRLENRLPRSMVADGLTDSHGPHGLASTNLHPHGLHISPEGESDNTFIRLDPGDAFTFRFEIPWTHPPGTFWYHPHKHGSVAYQLTNGLAGALIVEGGLDFAPELDGVKERVMVFQQFRYREGADGVRQVYIEDVYSVRDGSPPPSSGAPSTRTEDPTAINGVVTPMITARPGEVQRWRMIHAGLDATLKLNLEKMDGTKGPQLHEIAVDGIALGKIVPRDVVTMHPGYRSDVLVQFNEPGVYLLYTEVKEAERMEAFKEKAVPRTYVAKIFIDGTPRHMKLPPSEALASYAPPAMKAKISRERNIVFDRGPSSFNVNGREFDPRRTDHIVQLDSAEDWTITSEREGHPFHIHVNSFQEFVPAQNGDGEWIWRDTLFVPTGQSRKVRMEFLDFPGKTVMHCHNLDHEDQGMMQIVRISKDAKAEEERQRQTAITRVNSGRLAQPRPTPAWKLIRADGTTFSSTDFSGKKTLLIFHRGVGCEHCASQIEILARHAKKLEKLGIQVIAIAPGEPAARTANFVREKNIGFPMLSDPDLSVFKQFNLVRVDNPVLHAAFFVDTGGTIRWAATGENPIEISPVLEAAELLDLSGNPALSENQLQSNQ